MKEALIQHLRCPNSGQSLYLDKVDQPIVSGKAEKVDIVNGWLVSKDGNHRYPIRNGIPRFVPESNYADNFGLQWNYFAKTQLDSNSGQPISAERFWKATNWTSGDMSDCWVLDVGCGSGRFAEIALSTGAQVVALDYSSAVDACYNNLMPHPNINVVQGDIYSLPFEKGIFDFVYSLGVLQHTPDVARAFGALPPTLKSGGKLCVDYYEKSFKSRLLPKCWLRPLTKRMDKQKLFDLVSFVAPLLLPISRALGKVPSIGKLLKRIVPVANYEKILPLNEKQLLEWAILDTFDWLSPTYDNPQSAFTAKLWFEHANMYDIEVVKASHLAVRGTK